MATFLGMRRHSQACRDAPLAPALPFRLSWAATGEVVGVPRPRGGGSGRGAGPSRRPPAARHGGRVG